MEDDKTKQNDQSSNSSFETMAKTPDFFYPDNYKEKKIIDKDIPSSFLKFQNFIGFDSKRRYNMHFLSPKEIIFANGNTFQILNLETLERRVFQGSEYGGVGCIAVHPSRKYFAVGGCGDFPNIYIYEYPSLKLYRILRKGTEKAFACLEFNSKGDQLASVGSDPDYNMVIWNWMNEIIILKSKAFSQEIFKVVFSSNFEEKLITSGIGHIKFWQMAQTFTGLKLQGELGKFGQIDLSDISAFVEFPDGKVLSGTEYGTLLLWEGIFIKTQLYIGSEESCHNGIIDYMSWDGEYILSGGSDGTIKWWSETEIENAEIDDNYKSFVKPIQKETLTNPLTNQPIKIVNIIKENSFWLVQDSNGYIFKCFPKNNFSLELVFDFHAGSIRRVYNIQSSSLILSQGSDAKTVIFNLLKSEIKDKIIVHEEQNRQISAQSNIEGATILCSTCCDILVRELETDPLVLAVGYNNGLYKIMEFNSQNNKLDLLSQFKAHDEEIRVIRFSIDGSYIITVTKKEIFFFLIENLEKIYPICFIKLSHDIVDCDWHPDSKRVLVGLTNGTLEEIMVPLKFNSTETFHMPEYEKTVFTMKLADSQLEKEDEKKKRVKNKNKKPEPGPAPILSCKYYNSDGEILLTAQAPYNDFIYKCKINDNRPSVFWNIQMKIDFYIKYISQNLVFLYNLKGAVQIRPKDDLNRYLEFYPNTLSQVTDMSTSMDDTVVVLSFRDGTIVSFLLDIIGLHQFVKAGAEPEKKNFDLPEKMDNLLKSINSVKQQQRAEENKELEQINQEIEISLEKEKRKAEELARLKKAEEKKNELRKKVSLLKEQFNTVFQKNKYLEEELMLTQDELVVDENYLEFIRNTNKENLVDIKHKFDWKKEFIRVPIEKINEFFMNSIKTPKIYVLAFNTKEFVTTMRCPSLPNDFEEEIIKMDIQTYDNKKKIDFESLEESFKHFMIDEGNSKENDENRAAALFDKIHKRLNNQQEENVVKKGEVIKNEIKEELELNAQDLDEVEAVLKEKRLLGEKNKTKLDKKKDTKMEKDVNKLRKDEIIKCPDAYSLKLNNDKYYDEIKMRTTLYQRKIIYSYLKLIYEERERFNNEVLNLRDKKSDIIRILKDNKSKILKLNISLEITDENYDWLDQKMDEILEYPERGLDIKKEEIEKYLKEKSKSDKLAQEIYDEEKKKQEKQQTDQNQNNENVELVFKERQKKTFESDVEKELKRVLSMKYNYKKMKLIDESKKMIEDFDKELNEKKRMKINLEFKQKLGELELLVKHEEYNILRSFESDDTVLLKKLEDLFNNYKINLQNLKNCQEDISNTEEEKERLEKDREAKIKDFHNLIGSEKENRAKLEKIFMSRSKKPDNANDPNAEMQGEDDENLEERPRNVPNQVWNDIRELRERREEIDNQIDTMTKKIMSLKAVKKTLIDSKFNDDRKLYDIRDKINQTERKKSKYLNLLDFVVAIKLDQFCKFERSSNYKLNYIQYLSQEISKSILITQTKIEELKKATQSIVEQNKEHESEINKFNEDIAKLKNTKKELDNEQKKLNATFEEEQILKFGTIIKFDYLLKAAKDVTGEKLEQEYKLAKREADRLLDEYKDKISSYKKELQECIKENTSLLNDIKKLLTDNKNNDAKLEEKNNEINTKTHKKYIMFNIPEKKQKLKEILKLLQQQMDALKKEIDIFRRKGGHIYSTITSNLN